MKPRRGDVFWVNLDRAVGTEIKKTRAAVIVSNDSCNAYGLRVIVVPLTTNTTSLFPGEAAVTVGGRMVRALGDQMRSIDKGRLAKRLGRLGRADLASVDEALRITLDL